MRHGGDGGGGWEVAVRSASASLSADTISVFHVFSSMPTSELSDALNPNVVRQRTYDNALVYQDQRAHTDIHHPNFHYEQQSYEHVPHRSELELAVVEPTPIQRYVSFRRHGLRCSDEFAGHDLPLLIRRGSSCGYGTSSRRRRAGEEPGRRNTRLGSLVSSRRMKEGYKPCKKRLIHSRGPSGT